MTQLDQKIDEIQIRLLAEVADLHQVPSGAFNLRSNGQTAQRTTTANIDIVSKEDGTGIDIKIKPYTVHESVHIPVVLSQSGLTEMVYNDFYVGEGADVVIVAGCGIHNSGDQKSEHDGIHRFFIGKNAKVKYVEKHYGSGDGRGERILNPTTEITMEEGSYLEMESVQIKGVDSTDRKTSATFVVDLNGEDSSANVISRSVAKEESHQIFISRINGNTRCAGHTECDAIIMDHARIEAVPELTANNVDAALIHEAAIGKIAGEQIIKLMTLGLTEEEAEAQIVNGFLK